MKQPEEALLRQHQIASLEGPRKRALETVCGQFYKYGQGHLGNKKRRAMLAGAAEDRLDERNHRDLVAVRGPAEKDLLSRFLQDHWIFKVSTMAPSDFLILTVEDNENNSPTRNSTDETRPLTRRRRHCPLASTCTGPSLDPRS